jgi:hypothetical protein
VIAYLASGASTLEWKDRKKLETAKLVALGSKVGFKSRERRFLFVVKKLMMGFVGILAFAHM